MSYLRREYICKALCITPWQSYRMFKGNSLHLVREAEVLSEVNCSRIAMDPFKHVPELVKAEELSVLTGVPSKKLVLWTKRTKNPIPHVRFNKHTVRFSRAAAEKWLEEMAS